MYRGGEKGKRGDYLYCFIRCYMNFLHGVSKIIGWIAQAVNLWRWGFESVLTPIKVNLGSWMSGLVTSLQNWAGQFDSGTTLIKSSFYLVSIKDVDKTQVDDSRKDCTWSGGRDGQCEGLKILRCAFESHPLHIQIKVYHFLNKKMKLETLKNIMLNKCTIRDYNIPNYIFSKPQSYLLNWGAKKYLTYAELEEISVKRIRKGFYMA